MDGTEIKGTLKNIDRKKGQIEEVKLKGDDGKKHKLKAKEIKEMYLSPTGIEKLANITEFASDATLWDRNLDQDLMKDGYIFVENAEVRMGKKTRTLLMQLLNPSFSEGIKIYFDPKAKETSGLGIGGIQVTGGDAKSYYIKQGDDAAYRIKKKEYDKEFPVLFRSCKAVLDSAAEKLKWTDLAKHAYLYATECNKTSR